MCFCLVTHVAGGEPGGKVGAHPYGFVGGNIGRKRGFEPTIYCYCEVVLQAVVCLPWPGLAG